MKIRYFIILLLILMTVEAFAQDSDRSNFILGISIGNLNSSRVLNAEGNATASNARIGFPLSFAKPSASGALNMLFLEPFVIMNNTNVGEISNGTTTIGTDVKYLGFLPNGLLLGLGTEIFRSTEIVSANVKLNGSSYWFMESPSARAIIGAYSNGNILGANSNIYLNIEIGLKYYNTILSSDLTFSAEILFLK